MNNDTPWWLWPIIYIVAGCTLWLTSAFIGVLLGTMVKAFCWVINAPFSI